MICYYGCGQEARFQFKNGKWCCCSHYKQCPKIKSTTEVWNKGKTGVQPSTKKGKTYEEIYGIEKSKKVKSKSSVSHKGNLHSENTLRKMSLSRRNPKHRLNSIEFREEQKKRMEDWLAHKMLKNVQNPSKEELKLREIVKDLYPQSVDTYQVLENRGYTLDIALLENKIAIEFDGYFHFDTEDHKEYHKKRQKEIENQGWKFIKYTIFDKFPTKEQVKKDVESLLHSNRRK